jgi:hypothetical protein
MAGRMMDKQTTIALMAAQLVSGDAGEYADCGPVRSHMVDEQVAMDYANTAALLYEMAEWRVNSTVCDACLGSKGSAETGTVCADCMGIGRKAMMF